MASITIRRLDERIKKRLRLRAARNGNSMEQEAREILAEALIARKPAEENLAESIMKLFQPLGGVELEIPSRDWTREPPTFDR